MKTIFRKLSLTFIAATAILLSTTISKAQTLKINGSTANQDWTTCAQIPADIDIEVSYPVPTSYQSRQIEFTLDLYRNGTLFSSSNFANPQTLPVLIMTVYDQLPLSGSYQAFLTVKRHGYLSTTIEESNLPSNIITITRCDDVTFGTCTGDQDEETFTTCLEEVSIYQFVAGEYFVVQKNNGIIYKFNSLGQMGLNMWRITPWLPANLSGSSNLMGYQLFAATITDMIYTADGKTMISFGDGKVLKVSGTGGTGANMFNVTETANDFIPGSGTNYYVGHTKFLSGVNDLETVSGNTVISCSNGNMLKVLGSGGTAANMFAVTEYMYGFSTGGAYYLGQQHFLSGVNFIYQTGTTIFVALNDGKLMKTNGIGTGTNMFNITETSSTITSGGSYYIGHTKFLTPVTTMLYDGTFTFVALAGGKILKVNGLGGSAANMYAVTETTTTFTPTCCGYYSGYCFYSSAATTILHNPSGNRLLVGFANGNILKAFNSGGTGSNMFNATETTTGFVTTSPGSTIYLEGSASLNIGISDMKYFSSQLFVCTANSKIMKVIGDGGTAGNMFNVAQTVDGFRPLLGYTQWINGSQWLACYGGGRSGIIATEESSAVLQSIELSAYPNPFNENINIEFKGNSEQELLLSVYDLTGRKMEEKIIPVGTENIIIQTDNYSKGMYLVSLKNGNEVISSKKIIKQ